MKKLSLLSLSSLLLFSFSTDNEVIKSEQIAQAGGTVKIGVAIYDNSDTFMSTVRAGMEKRRKGAEKAVKLDVKYADGQKAQTTQNEQIDAFISQGVNVMCINIVDRTAAGPIIEKAKAANIPVVFFNRQPADSDMAKWNKAFYVGTPPEQSGQIQAGILFDHWTKNQKAVDKNGDGKLQYVLLKGEPGHQDAEMRTKVVKDFLTGKGIGDLLGEDTAMWQRVDGQSKMEAFLAKFGDKIEAVVANNDDMALGAIEALKGAGYFTGGKTIPVVGIDATAPAKDAVKQKLLLGTVINDADSQGGDTLSLAINLAAGRPLTTNVAALKGQLDMVPYLPYNG